MKKVLSLLVAFVFLQVQSWALSGGPVFGGSSAAVQGTYAGSMLPDVGGNSLGIFAIGVPATGLASGIFAMFVDGGAFYGSIVGVIDPDLMTLNALAQAQQNEVETFINAAGQQVQIVIPVALASGAIFATLSAPSKNGFSGNGNTSGLRVDGSGHLQTFDFTGPNGTPAANGVLDVTVVGFQQSTTTDGQINLNSLTGTQSATGS